MKIASCPSCHEGLAMIVCTVVLTNASAFFLSWTSAASLFVLLYGHGVSGWPRIASETPPCMSLHWSGTMKAKSGVVHSLARSAAKEVYGLTSAIRAAWFRMSSKRTNGLCFEA
jgi:hypothetical protein